MNEAQKREKSQGKEESFQKKKIFLSKEKGQLIHASSIWMFKSRKKEKKGWGRGFDIEQIASVGELEGNTSERGQQLIPFFRTLYVNGTNSTGST